MPTPASPSERQCIPLGLCDNTVGRIIRVDQSDSLMQANSSTKIRTSLKHKLQNPKDASACITQLQRVHRAFLIQLH